MKTAKYRDILGTKTLLNILSYIGRLKIYHLISIFDKYRIVIKNIFENLMIIIINTDDNHH